MLQKTVYFIITAIAFVSFLSLFYSGKAISERNFRNMLENNEIKLDVIDDYLAHHEQRTDEGVDLALQLAATMDTQYLDPIAHYYSIGNMLINMSTAKLFIQNLPSESIDYNYTVGRIYSSKEFNQYNPDKAVMHLDYAALRGNLNAAADLSKLYTEASCYVEAITWAKQANKKANRSECTKLPVNINLLSDEQWQDVIFNEEELEAAKSQNRLPKLRYSDQCSFN